MADQFVRIIDKHGNARAWPGVARKYLTEVVFAYEGDDCLIWPFGRFPNGYAQTTWNGKTCGAYVVVCEHLNGPRPSPGHDAAHRCGRGKDGCVNPNHLRWATRQENISENVERGTQAKGTKIGISKLNEEKVSVIREMALTTKPSRLAVMFGVAHRTIVDVVSRRTWKHVG